MNNIEKELLKEIIDIDEAPKGAYSIRKNGQGIEKKITENVNIVAKEDKAGIDIYVKETALDLAIEQQIKLCCETDKKKCFEKRPDKCIERLEKNYKTKADIPDGWDVVYQIYKHLNRIKNTISYKDIEQINE